MFETPHSFAVKRKHNDKEIVYYNLREIAQGSPEIGNIMINGKRLPSNYFFGGPPLFNQDNMFIPLYVRKFCKSGFIIAKIDLITNEVEFISKIGNLYFLKDVDKKSNELLYYEDMNKTNLKSIKI